MDESPLHATTFREVPAAEWDSALLEAGIRDIYYRRGYLDVAATIEPGTPVLLEASSPGGRVLCALIVREVPDADARDAISPYGYGGPLATGVDPPIAAWRAGLAAWAQRNDVVTTFIRFHPLYGNLGLADPATTELRALAGTVAWRIGAGGAHDLLGGMHGKHRNMVRRAHREGVTVLMERGPESLGIFVPLYERTMRRANAAASYFFSRAHWDTLAADLGPRMIFANAWLDGELVASALCLESHPWLHYHLGASAESGRQIGATTLVLYETAVWGRTNGYERLHLGGGVGGHEDSLMSFKRRFDPSGWLPATVGAQVHDPVRYRTLSGTDRVDGFFPAYRDPARARG